jgi:phosphohistidine phosphatase
MKRVYLLRHAKSSWKDASLHDRDRPLAGRGRRAAKAMARHIREHEIHPDLVVCSPARRARETLERVELDLGRGAVRIEPRLYGAGVDELLDVVRGLPDRAESVLLIGHNPTLQDFARIEDKFPTAALATLAFAVSHWRDVALQTGRLESVVRPRDLA